jgi:hypothetical protein
MPGLVTPGKRGSQEQAMAAHKPRSAVKPAAQAHAQVSKPAAKAPAAVSRRPPQDRAYAVTSPPKKKPIYLQSAASNTDDPLDRVLFSVPALSHLGAGDPEGDADGADVKASVDESGTVKITD